MTGGVEKKESGFTLVELMIVIAMVAILATIGVPSFIQIMPRMRLNNDTMILSNEIAVARLRAVSKSADFRIVFDTANDSYTIAKYVNTSPGVWDWKVMGTTLLTGTDLRSVTGFDTANTLMTDSMGSMNVPLSTQAVIWLQTPPKPPAVEGDIQKRIIVKPTGMVKVERRRVGDTWGED